MSEVRFSPIEDVRRKFVAPTAALHNVYIMHKATLVRARDQAHVILRGMIVRGELPPSSHVEEVRLSTQIGLSRTPVREALIALEQEGLVQSRPQRGFLVLSPDAGLVRETYPILSALEQAGLQAALDHVRKRTADLRKINHALQHERRKRRQYELDRAFHATLTADCGNARLLRLLQAERARAEMFDGAHVRGMANLEGSCAEHTQIIDALEKGDIVKATQILARHWDQGIEVVTKWLGSE